MNDRAFVEDQLRRLRAAIGADFAALASVDERDRAARWLYASGNENERYLRMRKKPGVGVTGFVVRHGRPFVLDDAASAHSTAARVDYPILLAERLRSAAAVPVLGGGRVEGVLLAGYRTARRIGPELLAAMESCARRFASAPDVPEAAVLADRALPEGETSPKIEG